MKSLNYEKKSGGATKAFIGEADDLFFCSYPTLDSKLANNLIAFVG